MQALIDHHRQFVYNTLTNRKPVKFTQDGRDVIKLLVSVVTQVAALCTAWSFFSRPSFTPYRRLLQ